MVSFSPVHTALDEAGIIPWVWIRQTNGEEVGYGNMRHTLSDSEYKRRDIFDVVAERVVHTVKLLSLVK